MTIFILEFTVLFWAVGSYFIFYSLTEFGKIKDNWWIRIKILVPTIVICVASTYYVCIMDLGTKLGICVFLVYIYALFSALGAMIGTVQIGKTSPKHIK